MTLSPFSLVIISISIALNIIAALLAPHRKTAGPPKGRDHRMPPADPGKAVRVVFLKHY